mgnify:CR=1 FL=1
MDDFPNEIDLLNLNRAREMKIMGWRPPQRPAWLKAYMKMPGPIKAQLLLLTILTTSSVSSTVLLISRQGGNTLVENTSPNVESLELGNGRLRLRVTGKSTTEVLRSLSRTLNSLDATFSDVRSSVSIQQKEQ